MLPETELVTALCRTPLSDQARRRIEVLLNRPVDWDLVLGRAAEWEVEPIVCSNIRASFPTALPAEVLQAVTDRERESRAHALARTLITVDVVKDLERAGIRVIVLKGPAVAVTAYGDPSLRSFADVDLLIRREDLTAARDLLVSRGYAPNYDPSAEATLVREQHALEFSRSNTRIELHWSLLERHLRLNVDVADLWSSSQTVPCAGSEIRVLAPQHLFLFLCAHGTKHEWDRPRWICDVAQLGQRLEPDAVMAVLALAARTHSRRILALGGRLVRDILGEHESPFGSDMLVPESDTRPLVTAVRRRLGVDGVPKLQSGGFVARLDPALVPVIFWVRSRERAIDRVACVARVLFVPTEKDRGGQILSWVRRPARLAARAIRRAATA